MYLVAVFFFKFLPNILANTYYFPSDNASKPFTNHIVLIPAISNLQTQ